MPSTRSSPRSAATRSRGVAVVADQARGLGLPLVDPEMLRVVAPARHHRDATGQGTGLVEQLPLAILQDRDLTRPSALRGGRLQYDLRTSVGVRRRELDRFFAAEPERVLQPDRNDLARSAANRLWPAVSPHQQLVWQTLLALRCTCRVSFHYESAHRPQRAPSNRMSSSCHRTQRGHLNHGGPERSARPGR